MAEQKFKAGDLVLYDDASILGPLLRDKNKHRFMKAIIKYSWAEKYGNGRSDNSYDYCIIREDGTSLSWVDESNIKLIEHDRQDLAEVWKEARKKKDAKESELSYIFTVPKSAYELSGASVEALAKCLGVENLWGSRGEGVVALMNSIAIENAAAPFIETHDLDGWLKFCEEYKNNKQTVKSKEK